MAAKVKPIERPRRRKPRPVADSWERIEAWLEEHAPSIRATLRKPAKQSDLRKLEKAIGFSLPDSFCESWLIHDGQNPYIDPEDDLRVPGVFFGLRPTSVTGNDGILPLWDADWRNPRTHARQEALSYDNFTSLPTDAIQNAVYRKGWIPWYWVGSREYLAIDLVPGPKGIVGQVIPYSGGFDIGAEQKYVLAESWAHFLQDVADEMEAGHAIETNPRTVNHKFELQGWGWFWNALPAWSAAKLPKTFREPK